MEEKSIIINGHEAVDLGLSVRWATCNIGANNPEDFGDYFAWGETEPKDEYSRENYMFYDALNKRTHIDRGMVISGTELDAARKLWGNDWRMPTQTEIEEFCDKCTGKWTNLNGVKGLLAIGRNGNRIFLPAAGVRYDSCLAQCGQRNRAGFCWSGTSNNDGAYGIGIFRIFGFLEYKWEGYCGFPIRPVTDK